MACGRSMVRLYLWFAMTAGHVLLCNVADKVHAQTSAWTTACCPPKQLPDRASLHCRVGDPSKELSAEFTLTLNASLQPYSQNYPVRCVCIDPPLRPGCPVPSQE